MGLVGIVLSVYALNKAFTMFASDSDQARLYAKEYLSKKSTIKVLEEIKPVKSVI